MFPLYHFSFVEFIAVRIDQELAHPDIPVRESARRLVHTVFHGPVLIIAPERHAFDPEYIQIGSALSQRKASAQKTFAVTVVAVHESDVLAPRHVQALVSCSGSAPVLLITNEQILLPAFELLQLLSSPVGRSVIDDDQFTVVRELAQHRARGFIQQVFAVICGNDHR